MHFLSTWLFRNAKYTCARYLQAPERSMMMMPFSLFGHVLLPLKALAEKSFLKSA